MIMTLFATLGGGLFRLLPEVLKFLERKDDRKHELAMFDRQLEADRMKGQIALDQTRAQAEGALNLEDVRALIEAIKAQAVTTGIKWVDAISSLMRPVITFWWVIVMYTGALIAQYVALVQQGATHVAAVITLWGADEKAIVGSIIGFWFADRSLRNKK